MELASLFVTISANMNPLNRGLDQARARVDGWMASTNRAVGMASTALLGIVAAGGAAAAVGLYKGVQAAASLNESLSKASAVFGPEAKAITDAADEMAKKFGTSKQTFVDMATEAGILAQGIGGLNNKDAAQFGAKITKMADDLVSFADVAGGVPEAMQRISSGLRGESEPMSRYGVIMQEDQVKAEALRMGIAKLGKELTQQQKFAARASLLETGLAKARGDHERTAGSAKNRQREVGGRGANVLTDVGQAVLPAWTEVINVVNRAAVALSAFVERSKSQLTAWGAWAAERVRAVTAVVIDLGMAFREFLGAKAWQPFRDAGSAAMDYLKGFGSGAFDYLTGAIDLLGVGLRNFDDVAQLVGVNLGEAFTNAGETIAWAAGVAEDFGSYLASNWRSLATDAVNAISAAVTNLGSNIKAVLDALASFARGEGFEVKLKPVLEGFEAKSAAFKVRERKVSDFGDQKKEITDRIAAKEAKRKPTVIAPADMGVSGGATPATASAPAAAAGGKHKTQFFQGGQDLSNAIQAAALGTGDKKAEEKAIVKNTAEIVQELKEKGTTTPPAPPAVVIPPAAPTPVAASAVVIPPAPAAPAARPRSETLQPNRPRGPEWVDSKGRKESEGASLPFAPVVAPPAPVVAPPTVLAAAPAPGAGATLEGVLSRIAGAASRALSTVPAAKAPTPRETLDARRRDKAEAANPWALEGAKQAPALKPFTGTDAEAKKILDAQDADARRQAEAKAKRDALNEANRKRREESEKRKWAKDNPLLAQAGGFAAGIGGGLGGFPAVAPGAPGEGLARGAEGAAGTAGDLVSAVFKAFGGAREGAPRIDLAAGQNKAAREGTATPGSETAETKEAKAAREKETKATEAVTAGLGKLNETMAKLVGKLDKGKSIGATYA